MLNILRSDFYKLFKRKSFYICGIIAALLGLLDVWVLNNEQQSILEYDGIYTLGSSLGNVTLLLTIFTAMFIPSEFSFGTIKNIASRGASRTNIYLSKLIVSSFVTFAYSLFSGIVGFTAGSIMWEVGEFKQENVIKVLCLFLLAELALQSINVMIGFVVRHSGGTVAIILGIIMLVPTLIINLINFISKAWFNFTLESYKYWLAEYYTMNHYLPFGGSYSTLKTGISSEVFNTGVIVSLVYLAVSSAIGLYVFNKRDIK